MRDQGVLTLAEGIRRLTSLPAARLGVHDRGTLERDNWADITVFDADQIASHCDVREPRRFATGIAHVLVNGVFSMRDGTRTGNDAGRVLRSH